MRGVAVMLERAGFALKGADMMIDSDVPIGSGLSSSAALEVSVGFALLDLAGVAVDRVKLPQPGIAAAPSRAALTAMSVRLHNLARPQNLCDRSFQKAAGALPAPELYRSMKRVREARNLTQAQTCSFQPKNRSQANG